MLTLISSYVQGEVSEYAKWLGMDLAKDRSLFWIAKEGLKAPLPENWKPCKTVDTEEIYYFNFATGDHSLKCINVNEIILFYLRNSNAPFVLHHPARVDEVRYVRSVERTCNPSSFD